MKSLILFAVMLIGTSAMVSCGLKCGYPTKSDTTLTDSADTVDTTVVDTLNVDTLKK
nr:MAG TPA: hypothetical protein [Caudoviricetes sp.]